MKILLINGGRGAKEIIKHLIKNKRNNVISLVNAYDDGKSTGEIRKHFNILGPSDIRKVQQNFLDIKNKHFRFINKVFDFRFDKNISREEALIQISSKNFKSKKININFNLQKNLYAKEFSYFLNITYKHFLNKKFIKFNFSDCSLMNLVYVGAIDLYKGKLSLATSYFNKLLPLKGKVIINSDDLRFLVGIRENGEIIKDEEKIVNFRSNIRISKLMLLKDKKDIKKIDIRKKKFVHLPARITEESKFYIENSDVIIYCPGTQHSSLLPTYMTTGFCKSIKLNKNAKKFFITNIGEDYETPSFTASDYIVNAYQYINSIENRKLRYDKLFNYNLVNLPSKLKKNFVPVDYYNLENINVKTIIKNFSKFSDKGKHDGKKLCDEIFNLLA